ncbi:adenylate kinase 7-like [Osmerus eperlanus]|uniref:adenylate kinase 7-like n=1 Tax=Osmerus eperlanus TaxID=29151 RepID=UPI002E132AE9
MAEEKKEVHRTKRIFVNNIDTYSSKYIAKFLSTCIAGQSLEEVDAAVDDEDKPIQEPSLRDGTFQVVGTVGTKEGNEDTFALEQYSSSSREELLLRLLECDVVVYNISENATPELIDEATWALTAIHAQMDGWTSQKMFILVSSVMTWALSTSDDPELPFTEDDYRKKKPHPNFKEHTNLEKLLLKLGKVKKSKLTCYVVAAGLQYGMGENMFHFFFKASWQGQFEKVPIFGRGTNVIPTVHINDLAGVIQNVIDHKPKMHYFLAVDDSNNTYEDIVKAISHALGPGKINTVPKEEAYITKALTSSVLDYFSVNLRIEPALIKESFNLRWVSEAGIVENISAVVEEYKKLRHLLPVTICLMGPPAVGKSTVAEKLCKHYKLHHIKIKDTIDEKLAFLEDGLNVGLESEAEDSVSSTQDLLNALKDNMTQNDGRLEDLYVNRILRDKLNSKQCRNQGYVLDGYPKTYIQAKDLFYEQEMESMYSPTSKIPMYNKKIIPEFVFSLEASDNFLTERVQNLPEGLVEKMHYRRDEFLRRLEKYREMNVEDETVLNYFDELEIHPEHIEVKDSQDVEYTAVVEKIMKVVGSPRNYGPTPEEKEAQDRRMAKERQHTTALEAAENKRRKAAIAAKMTAQLDEWNRHVAEVKRQEYELQEARSIPLRNYLMQYVMPTLTKGMVECSKAKPDDPVDFLAEYLLRDTSQD